MLDFPTIWTVGLHRYDASAVNAQGAPVKRWNPPKSEPGELIYVIGWAAQGGVSPAYEPNQDRTVLRMELYLPPVLHNVNGDQVDDPGLMDVIDLPAVGQCEVLGPIRDYTRGFHGWRAGKVLDLQRVI